MKRVSLTLIASSLFLSGAANAKFYLGSSIGASSNSYSLNDKKATPEDTNAKAMGKLFSTYKGCRY